MIEIGVIGVGFVGSAVSTGMQNIAEVREYDKFKDTESLYSVVENSDILFLCLPTPMASDGSCDISILEEVSGRIDRNAEETKIIVVKSTVPPGTTQKLADRYPNHQWVFNPEYLTEARFIQDFLEQDRTVLGYTEQCEAYAVEMMLDLYKAFGKWQAKTYQNTTLLQIMNCKSEEAEMAKYVANCFLATKVTFCNEMKQICDAAKIDYGEVLSAVLLDKRIGKSHMQVPGPDGKHGFGGPCFSKDTNALISFADDVGVDPLVLESVWTKNLMVREEYEWEDLAQVTGEYDK